MCGGWCSLALNDDIYSTYVVSRNSTQPDNRILIVIRAVPIAEILSKAYLREAETLRFEGYVRVGRRVGKGTNRIGPKVYNELTLSRPTLFFFDATHK